MFTFSLLQNYLKKQTNLSHNPKYNPTMNICALCANSYLEGFSSYNAYCWAPASPPQALEHPGLLFLIWSCRTHCPHVGSQIWVKLDCLPDGFGFRSNHDPTGWLPCGMPQHPPAPPISHAPLRWPESLEGKPTLAVLCSISVSYVVPPQAWAQWGTPMQWFSGSETEWAGPQLEDAA